VNTLRLIADMSHLTDHLRIVEDSVRGAAIALLPTFYRCAREDGAKDGSFGQFEGVVRPPNPAPISPESIRVFPNQPTFSSPTFASSPRSPIPSLISDHSSSISVLSEGEELWEELSNWFKGGEEDRAALLAFQEGDARSVEIVGGGDEGGSLSGGSIGFETEYFGDSEGEL
jgi:hypothetical protein